MMRKSRIIIGIIMLVTVRLLWAQIEYKLFRHGIPFEEGDNFGQAVAICGDIAAVGAPNHHVDDVEDAGMVYFYKYDPSDNSWTGANRLFRTQENQLFGYALDMHKTTNGIYIIIGAPWNDTAGEKAGAAYIYRYDDGDLEYEGKIMADDATPDDRFGISVAIAEDKAIVGAFFDDDQGDRSGSAYIFHRNAGGWEQVKKITATDGTTGDWFGVHVAISPLYAAVGARYDDHGGEDAGAVYMYNLRNNNWNFYGRFVAEKWEANVRFEKCAFGYLDLGMGVTENYYFAVGAYNDNDKGKHAGAVYLYKQEGTGWKFLQKLTASDGAAGDNFGCSVSMTDQHLIVGAYGDDDDGSNAGAVYVFKYTESGWKQLTKLKVSDGDEGNHLGLPVDACHDRYGLSVIAGASKGEENGLEAGSAYIIRVGAVLPVPKPFMTISEAMRSATFGDTVLVGPGTWYEPVTIKPWVVLKSKEGPSQTALFQRDVDCIVSVENYGVLEGFTIYGNDNGEDMEGNGVYAVGRNVTIRQCIIRRNSTGIYLPTGSKAHIYNNTILGNRYDGIFIQRNGTPNIYNNIISSHGRAGIFRMETTVAKSPVIKYNDYFKNITNYGSDGEVWTPLPGTGELYQNPHFVSQVEYDFRLAADSPCIDKGDPASPRDPDGTRADLGALYYDQGTAVFEGQKVFRPEGFNLYPAFPNPFNPSTTIQYELPRTVQVEVSIYNLHGQLIKVLQNIIQPAGFYTLQWDGRDQQGRNVASGIYLCRILAGSFQKSVKLMLMR
ncbi:right-handed parallel beta-helix repeat-containing protein [candidate division KSB1 bacterium]|nr:right-handed parallel beta-helix repeat-containing protein [candidate division KSB1 bacterium]